MATKAMEQHNYLSCLNKAEDSEPVFVLRAQDKFGSILVNLWIAMARLSGCPEHKLAQARQVQADMERWPSRKYPD